MDSFPKQFWGSGPQRRTPGTGNQDTSLHRAPLDTLLRRVRLQEVGWSCVVLIDPNGDQLKYMVHLEFKAPNNLAEYEALIFGLTQALSLGVRQLLVKGDSQLIIK